VTRALSRVLSDLAAARLVLRAGRATLYARVEALRETRSEALALRNQAQLIRARYERVPKPAAGRAPRDDEHA